MRSTHRRSRATGRGSNALRASALAVISGAAAFGGDTAATGVAAPAFPALRPMPAAERTTIDYAEPAYADAWLRRPILGDPSFDAFTRAAGNPLVRGTAPFLWPVNIFLLDDPRSGSSSNRAATSPWSASP